MHCPSAPKSAWAAVDGQEVLPHARAAHAVEPLRRRVDTQHDARVVEQDEPLAHTAGDLREFVGLFAQLAQLCPDLDVLVVDALEQRRELLIGVIIERVLEIEAVERIDDTPRQAPGQHAREDKRRDEHEQQRLEHTDGARGVVLKALGIGPGVVQNAAVGRDPRQAAALGRQLREIVRAAAFHGGRGEAQLVAQLVFFHAAEIAVEKAHDDQQACQQHGTGHEEDGLKDFLGHVVASIR